MKITQIGMSQYSRNRTRAISLNETFGRIPSFRFQQNLHSPSLAHSKQSIFLQLAQKLEWLGQTNLLHDTHLLPMAK